MAIKTVTALNKQIEDFLKERGAIRVGFATLETLAGGPPSVDLTYVLPEARSAISFALPLDLDIIRDFLAKKEGSHAKCEAKNIEVNKKATELGKELAQWLTEKGFKAHAPLQNNNIYRTEMKGWKKEMWPDIAHRYIAARSGIGAIGWSGNIVIKDWGANIILNTVVTDAELEPTDLVPPAESACSNCKLCVAVCPARFFDAKETDEITMGGTKFSYSKRHHKYRCQLVCGGFSGLHYSKKWSTWSPGRFVLPEGDDENALVKALADSALKYLKWQPREPPGGFDHPLLKGKKLRMTCGNCHKVCFGNKEETQKNFDILINSGCVLQKPGGEIIVLPPDEAQKVFDEFPRKHRKLYIQRQFLV